MKDVDEGGHIPLDDGRERGEYVEYSRTSSGWTIYSNPEASFAKRWRINHPRYGERFFPNHDLILPWTLDNMRKQFKLHPEHYRLQTSDEMKKVVTMMEEANAKHAAAKAAATKPKGKRRK